MPHRRQRQVRANCATLIDYSPSAGPGCRNECQVVCQQWVIVGSRGDTRNTSACHSSAVVPRGRPGGQPRARSGPGDFRPGLLPRQTSGTETHDQPAPIFPLAVGEGFLDVCGRNIRDEVSQLRYQSPPLALSVAPPKPCDAAAIMYRTGCPGRCWMACSAAEAASAYLPA